MRAAGSTAGEGGEPGAERLTATWIAWSGSGLLTGQSLPAARVAPERSSAPNWYCHVARSGPRKGIVRSSICGSWVAHSACALAATPSSAKRGTSSG